MKHLLCCGLLLLGGGLSTTVYAATNTPPVISGTPEKTILPNQLYNFEPQASDADGDPLTFIIKNKPGWAEFDATSGRLSGTPATDDRQTYKSIRIGVSDGKKTRWLKGFSITVQNTLPVITGTPETSLFASESYTFKPLASDRDNDELTYFIRKKPDWATFNAETGELSGTPGADKRKKYSGIRIGVRDIGTKTVWLKSFSIKVENNLPVISGTPELQAKVGEPYSFKPEVSDADSDTQRFTIKKRPGWATFNKQTGELSGTPRLKDQDKDFAGIVIKAIDQKNGKAELPEFSIHVVNENFDEPPVMTGAPATSINVGESYHFTPVTQYSGGGTLTFSVKNKPDWLDFDPATGTLSGTPGVEHIGVKRNIRITAGDGIGKSSTFAGFNIRVNSIQTSRADAHRLLLQASFGPTTDSLQAVMSQGIESWIDQQLSMRSAYDRASDDHLTHLERTIEIAQLSEPGTNWYGSGIFNQSIASHTADDYQMAAWWENALEHPDNPHGNDQLRQRVAYALSQILVVSNKEAPLHQRGEALAFYYDILARNAFGNFRTLIDEVARSPAMGIYLSHQGNRKANLDAATRPDENFARELIQLFTIGLYELNIDGSPNRDANPDSYPDAGTELVPTYTQDDISEMAKVMTGWDLAANSRYGYTSSRTGDYTQFMEFTPAEHEDEIVEGGDGMVTIMGQSIGLNSGSDGSGLDAALDRLFQHPNVGPFISRLLIQRMVTSNPSGDYIARVATVFNDNGSGVRGDLKAVVRAILLDDEARNPLYQYLPSFGKAKEPLLALTQFLRAFNVWPMDGWKGFDKQSRVNGVYWYKYPERDFAQGALRANSVFNFYLPDFVPSDVYFDQNRLTAPELQILSDQALVEINNKLLRMIYNGEVNKITTINGKTLSDWAANKSFWSGEFMLFDFDQELQVYEQALDGDNNGDFSNMHIINPVTGERHKARAIDALLTHLDQKLLGGTMPEPQQAALKHYLLNGQRAAYNNNYKEAWGNIKDAVRFIAISNTFMVQK